MKPDSETPERDAGQGTNGSIHALNIDFPMILSFGVKEPLMDYLLTAFACILRL